MEDWQKIMQVHSLVVSPQEDMRSWLKYASLCRKAGRMVIYCINFLNIYCIIFLYYAELMFLFKNK